MLSPKKVQWRKVQKGRMRGKAYRGSDVSFGEYGLMATEPARITARQIEAARIAMTRYAKRGGNIWIRIFPDKPITQKPAETRMGKVKVARNTGLQSFNPVAFSMRWTAFPRKSLAKHSVSPRINCL